MAVKAVTFDAYGTLLRNEALMRIPRRLRQLGVAADPAPYVDLFFQVTTIRHLRGRPRLQAEPSPVPDGASRARAAAGRGPPRPRQ